MMCKHEILADRENPNPTTSCFMDDDRVSPTLQERLATELEGAKSADEVFGEAERAAENKFYHELDALRQRYAEEYWTLWNARTFLHQEHLYEGELNSIERRKQLVNDAITALLSENE